MGQFYPWTTDSFNGMPYRRLGNTGLRVPLAGLGTWKFGYPESGDESRTGEEEAMMVLDRAYSLGVTLWDTANRYNNGSGNSERIIGKWLEKNPDKRRDVIIATKVFGGMDGFTPNHSRLSRANIIDSVNACLERLRSGHIDILYFHSHDSETPAEESLMAVNDLVGKDIVRYFAVSNFTVEQVRQYEDVLEKRGMRFAISAVQNRFDILRGEDNPGVLDYCAKRKISFIAWSPLAGGLLTDRYLDPAKIGAGDRLYDEGMKLYDDRALMEKLRKLGDVATKAGIGISRLALSYMLTIPGMGPVIPSASSVRQLEQNAEAAQSLPDGALAEEIRKILG